MFKPVQCSDEVNEAVIRACKRFNLPRWWLYAIIARESGFDPKAINDFDHMAGQRWEGSGITQLTGHVHCGRPYPYDLETPNNNLDNWRWDMGLNTQYMGPDWIKMEDVDPLPEDSHDKFESARFQPYHNLIRFCSVHAVPFYLWAEKKYPGETADQLLSRTAFHYNRGLPYQGDSYRANDLIYLGGNWGYNFWVKEFKAACEAEDGVWDGKPRLKPLEAPPPSPQPPHLPPPEVALKVFAEEIREIEKELRRLGY